MIFDQMKISDHSSSRRRTYFLALEITYIVPPTRIPHNGIDLLSLADPRIFTGTSSNPLSIVISHFFPSSRHRTHLLCRLHSEIQSFRLLRASFTSQLLFTALPHILLRFSVQQPLSSKWFFQADTCKRRCAVGGGPLYICDAGFLSPDTGGISGQDGYLWAGGI